MSRQPNTTARRTGFTLVELLVVVLIITILATIALFALFNAGEFAKKARTRAQIAKIHELLMPLWESYITRRVPLEINVPDLNDPTEGRKRLAKDRTNALREMMRMDFPDRMADVTGSPALGLPRSALSTAYKRKADNVPAPGGWTPDFEGPECLYLILSRIQDGDSNGLEFFHANEFGDIDKDGMPEILDGWGGAIRFLRWAPGFVAPNSALQNTTAADPLDPTGALGVPPNSYALYPFVFSAGADTTYGINFDAALSPAHDPFSNKQRGAPESGGGWEDNIHNHMIDINIR